MNKSSTFWELFCSLPPAFSLRPLDYLFSPQVVLVPGLHHLMKTQRLICFLPLTHFLPCLKCAASLDLRCPMAWMPLFAVVRVTDSGVGMSPSAQVGLSSTKNVCHFRSLHNGIHNTGNEHLCVRVRGNRFAVLGTCACVTDGQGINITQCLHKTNTETGTERYWGMKPLCDGVDWDIAQLGPTLLVAIATRALVVHIGFLEILHLNC